MSTLAVDRSEAVEWSSPRPAPRVRRRVARLRHAAIEADLSCGLSVVLVAWISAAAVLPATDPGHGVTTYWVAGLTAALCVAASLLFHELGHALAARRAGLGVSRITLSFAGGATQIVGTIRDTAGEIWIAVAGPVATVATTVFATAAHIVIVDTVGPGLPATVAALVACANVVLLLLNAIPALPFDGGRVLRPAVCALTRRPEAAARLMRAMGRALSDAMIGLALLASALGFVWIALSAGVLGFVVRQGEPQAAA